MDKIIPFTKNIERKCYFCGACVVTPQETPKNETACLDCAPLALLMRQINQIERDQQRIRVEIGKTLALVEGLIAKTDSLLKAVTALEGISPG